MFRNAVDPCVLCPRECQASRLANKTGWCKLGSSALLSAYLPHKGEEPPLVENAGSGTIFLSGCNANCCFCQNYQISREYAGHAITTEALAQSFLELQAAGCANINWVSPTPHLPFLVEALALAVDRGLVLPLVYNTNGYMRTEILALLDGIVDIYLTDMKYGDDIWAETYSRCPDYCDINTAAVTVMIDQVGPFPMNDSGLPSRMGVIVRHLVLPEGRSGYSRVFRRLAEMNSDVPVSLMAQYKPCFQTDQYPEINRPITKQEYQDALDALLDSGVKYAFTQSPDELDGHDPFFPDFNRKIDEIFS